MSDVVGVSGLEAWMRDFAGRIDQAEQHLTELDSAIGDADHGINMARGMGALRNALDSMSPASANILMKQVGMALVSSIGGASGPLYGTFFLRFAAACGDAGTLSASAFATAMRAGVDGVVARGKAEAGDKTMFDALSPAVEALDACIGRGATLAEALAAAAAAAEAGRDATIPLVARKGRASYLGERSAGHQDPGATSAALLIAAATATLG